MQFFKKIIRRVRKFFNFNRMNIHIQTLNLHIHMHGADESFLTQKFAEMSAKADELNAKMDRIVTATNGVAGDIRGIKDELTDGLTKEEAAALSDRLETAATKLESLDAETADTTAGGGTEGGDAGAGGGVAEG